MEEDTIREAQLRRDLRARGLVLQKTRRRGPGSEHGPYHVLEPLRNLALSATRYPNGMTLDEAETFVTQQ